MGECFGREDKGDVGEPRNLPAPHNTYSQPYSPIGRKTVKQEDAILTHRKHCVISAPRREDIDLLTPITNVPTQRGDFTTMSGSG
jgi:hypothetical protein